MQGRPEFYGPLSLIVVILCMIAAHLSLLRVPYFWDETYFATAARDLFLTGKLIPTTVPAESHPPLVYLWLAAWWKLFGFNIPVARIAMLAAAAVTLVAIYRLARMLTTGAVPIVVTALTAAYPVFFVESTLVQLDMAAAGLTLWGVVAYLEGRRWNAGVMFGLAVLAKETTIVAPCAVLAAEFLVILLDRRRDMGAAIRSALRTAFPLLLPFLALLCWFAWLYHATGFALGDPGYVKYNVQDGLRPMRIVLACLQHFWHLPGYLNLFVLTGLAAILFATRPRLPALGSPKQYTRGWLMLVALTAGYILMLSVVGGGILARYLLPVYPIVVLASVAAIGSRVKWWPAVAGLSAVAFVVGLFPYTNRFLFRRDDNLAYLDYVALHQTAMGYIAGDNKTKVLTIWPGSNELSMPWLGYTKQPREFLEIASFTRQELLAARPDRPQYILMFSRRVCEVENPILRARWWHVNYFRAKEEVSPDELADVMNARVIYRGQRHCDWVAVLKVDDSDTSRQGQSAP